MENTKNGASGSIWRVVLADLLLVGGIIGGGWAFLNTDSAPLMLLGAALIGWGLAGPRGRNE